MGKRRRPSDQDMKALRRLQKDRRRRESAGQRMYAPPPFRANNRKHKETA